MAAYDYRCRSCDVRFEIRRGVTEPAGEVRCPAGHDDVGRIWAAVAVTGGGRGTATAPAPAAGSCCGGGCCG